MYILTVAIYSDKSKKHFKRTNCFKISAKTDKIASVIAKQICVEQSNVSGEFYELQALNSCSKMKIHYENMDTIKYLLSGADASEGVLIGTKSREPITFVKNLNFKKKDK